MFSLLRYDERSSPFYQEILVLMESLENGQKVSRQKKNPNKDVRRKLMVVQKTEN